jgi:hypothetical protein
LTGPLYRDRIGRRAQPDVTEQQIDLHRLYRTVFGTPEGLKVLDDICERICALDRSVHNGDPLSIMEINGRRNVGIEIATLALAPFDAKKPEVRG